MSERRKLCAKALVEAESALAEHDELAYSAARGLATVALVHALLAGVDEIVDAIDRAVAELPVSGR